MRILLVEDAVRSDSSLEAMLKASGHLVEIVDGCLDAEEALQSPDSPRLLVVADRSDLGRTLELCRAVRQVGDGDRRYVMVLVKQGNEAGIKDAIEAGADDVLELPTSEAMLQVRLRLAARLLEQQEDLLIVQEQLRYQATHDGLTRLHNRHAIMDAFQREFARAVRGGQSLSVVLADIDRFKEINDTFGHGAGDIVLKELANLFRGSIRTYDALGRFGGEEFLFILPGCGPDEARIQTDRVRSLLADTRINVGELELTVTVSMGIACYSGREADNPELLIDAAEEALAQANKEGRDRVIVAG